MTADSTTHSENPETSSVLGEVPQMRAETGFGETEQVTPLRFSGFICLLLGLISAVAMLGLPALVIPVLALLFGLIALRPARGQKPIGTTPAKIGILLAIGFGFCGYFLPWMKTHTLGEQAKYFSRQYMGVVARDYDEFGIELTKDFRNRFNTTMPLQDYYNDGNENAMRSLDEFQGNSANAVIRREGPDAQWVLDRPIRVYKQFGIDRAEVVWKSAETGKLIQFFMQYLIDGEDTGQWHIEIVQEYRERIVAESIL